MNNIEYENYLNTLTKEELIKECLSLKKSYDLSCFNYSKAENLRELLMIQLSNFKNELSSKMSELEKANIQEYNNTIDQLETKKGY